MFKLVILHILCKWCIASTMAEFDSFDSRTQREAMKAAYSAVQSVLPRDPAARSSWKALFDDQRVPDALSGLAPGLAASTMINSLLDSAKLPRLAALKRHGIAVHAVCMGLGVLVSAVLQTRPTSALSRLSTFGMMADVLPAAEHFREAYIRAYPSSPLLPRIAEQAAGVAAAAAGAERAGEPLELAVKQARRRAAAVRFVC